MKATKIKMKLYCGSSKNVQDIDSIYIDSTGTYWKKERVHEYLKTFPKINTGKYFPISIFSSGDESVWRKICLLRSK